MATKAAELYEQDFYAWTQEQAKALRTHFQGDNRLDVEHLAEEIEDIGKSQLEAAESYLEQIIAHLLKLHYSGFDLPRGHWRKEIVAFRNNLRRKMSPSIERSVRERLPELYASGRKLAAAALDAEPDVERRLPRECPYSWDEIAALEPAADGGRGRRSGRGRAT